MEKSGRLIVSWV